MNIQNKEIECDVLEELEPYLHMFHKANITHDKLISCSPFRDDETPSFFIRLTPYLDISEGVWSDSGGELTYKSGRFPKLLAFLMGVTEYECEQYLLEKYSITISNIRLRVPHFAVQTKKQPLPYTFIQNRVKPSDYLTKRGISQAVQTYFHTGVDEKNHVILIPWFNEKQEMVSVKYRKTTSKIFYYEKGGYPISQLVYGIDKIYEKRCKTAVLVESEIDALTLWSNGIPSVAMGGSNFSDEKAQRLIRSPLEHLYIATDNDKAGQNIRNIIAKKLVNYINIYHAYVPTPYKDINEANDKKIFYEMIKNAQKIKKTFHFSC